MVLLVSDSEPASVANVPVVGTVTFVVPVLVIVTLLAPDVASVEPLASVKVPVVVETVSPLNLPAVMSPVVSAIVTAEFWTSFPVVPSNLATALSVEDAGPTTSPAPDTVAQVNTDPSHFR